MYYDLVRIRYNSGTKRICENCNQKCLATLYCEHCVRNYLKSNFSNWTSGNDDIDSLIQKCQMETLRPDTIVEWIPYNNFQNIKFSIKDGFSEIYTAVWVDGYYKEWDCKKQQLKRFGPRNVVLKRLKNVESANQSWFEEAKSYLTISFKWPDFVPCFGLTQDPSNGHYMLVMNRMSLNLREYLQQNHNQLTWEERVGITFEIINALFRIHQENAIHRNLHSGNILHSSRNDNWYMNDLGFCGPTNKPSTSVYGNLPYIAPEVLKGKGYTFKSDVYSIAMLMWEISSGQPPFMNHDHDYNLAVNIINGMRPKIVSGTPLGYKRLIEQCWDADPLKRPDIGTLWNKIDKMNLSYHQSNKSKNIRKFFKKINLFQLFKPKTNNNLETDRIKAIETNYTGSRLFASRVYKFENLPEPKNATKGIVDIVYLMFYYY
ncbi:kinase-like domain-containing protein [Glomus cerebriforme]|uniref:Kinase-like domain-containing protein n=1 Tax=Glomus cerebriforme TaxID=658196 RepID=A0A397SGZ2_9GLOM|nr:kinase-like domain-containing protein [Glomus cerebriforme]